MCNPEGNPIGGSRSLIVIRLGNGGLDVVGAHVLGGYHGFTSCVRVVGVGHHAFSGVAADAWAQGIAIDRVPKGNHGGNGGFVDLPILGGVAGIVAFARDGEGVAARVRFSVAGQGVVRILNQGDFTVGYRHRGGLLRAVIGGVRRRHGDVITGKGLGGDGGSGGGLLTVRRQGVVVLAVTAQGQTGDVDGFVFSRVGVGKGAGALNGQAVAIQLAGKRNTSVIQRGCRVAVIGLVLGGDAADGDGFGADGEGYIHRQTIVVVGFGHREAGGVAARVGGDGIQDSLILEIGHLCRAELGASHGGIACPFAVSPAGDGGIDRPVVDGLRNPEDGPAARMIPLIVFDVLQLKLHRITADVYIGAALVRFHGVQVAGRNIRRQGLAGVFLTGNGGGGDGGFFDLKVRLGVPGQVVIAVIDGGGDGVGACLSGYGGAVVDRAVIGGAGIGQSHEDSIAGHHIVQFRRGGGDIAVGAAARGDGHGDVLGVNGGSGGGLLAGFRQIVFPRVRARQFQVRDGNVPGANIGFVKGAGGRDGDTRDCLARYGIGQNRAVAIQVCACSAVIGLRIGGDAADSDGVLIPLIAEDADMVLKNVVFRTICVVGIARGTRAAGSLIHRSAGEVGGFVPGARVKVLLPGSGICTAIEQVGYLAAGEFLGGFCGGTCGIASSIPIHVQEIFVIVAVADLVISAETSTHAATIIVSLIYYSSAAGTVGDCVTIHPMHTSAYAANAGVTGNHAAAEAVCYRAGSHLTAHTADMTAGEVGIRYDYISNGRFVQIAKQAG